MLAAAGKNSLHFVDSATQQLCQLIDAAYTSEDALDPKQALYNSFVAQTHTSILQLF